MPRPDSVDEFKKKVPAYLNPDNKVFPKFHLAANLPFQQQRRMLVQQSLTQGAFNPVLYSQLPDPETARIMDKQYVKDTWEFLHQQPLVDNTTLRRILTGRDIQFEDMVVIDPATAKAIPYKDSASLIPWIVKSVMESVMMDTKKAWDSGLALTSDSFNLFRGAEVIGPMSFSPEDIASGDIIGSLGDPTPPTPKVGPEHIYAAAVSRLQVLKSLNLGVTPDSTVRGFYATNEFTHLDLFNMFSGDLIKDAVAAAWLREESKRAGPGYVPPDYQQFRDGIPHKAEENSLATPGSVPMRHFDGLLRNIGDDAMLIRQMLENARFTGNDIGQALHRVGQLLLDAERVPVIGQILDGASRTGTAVAGAFNYGLLTLEGRTEERDMWADQWKAALSAPFGHGLSHPGATSFGTIMQQHGISPMVSLAVGLPLDIYTDPLPRFQLIAPTKGFTKALQRAGPKHPGPVMTRLGDQAAAGQAAVATFNFSPNPFKIFEPGTPLTPKFINVPVLRGLEKTGTFLRTKSPLKYINTQSGILGVDLIKQQVLEFGGAIRRRFNRAVATIRDKIDDIAASEGIGRDAAIAELLLTEEPIPVNVLLKRLDRIREGYYRKAAPDDIASLRSMGLTLEEAQEVIRRSKGGKRIGAVVQEDPNLFSTRRNIGTEEAPTRIVGYPDELMVPKPRPPITAKDKFRRFRGKAQAAFEVGLRGPIRRARIRNIEDKIQGLLADAYRGAEGKDKYRKVVELMEERKALQDEIRNLIRQRHAARDDVRLLEENARQLGYPEGTFPPGEGPYRAKSETYKLHNEILDRLDELRKIQGSSKKKVQSSFEKLDLKHHAKVYDEIRVLRDKIHNLNQSRRKQIPRNPRFKNEYVQRLYNRLNQAIAVELRAVADSYDQIKNMLGQRKVRHRKILDAKENLKTVQGSGASDIDKAIAESLKDEINLEEVMRGAVTQDIRDAITRVRKSETALAHYAGELDELLSNPAQRSVDLLDPAVSGRQYDIYKSLYKGDDAAEALFENGPEIRGATQHEIEMGQIPKAKIEIMPDGTRKPVHPLAAEMFMDAGGGSLSVFVDEVVKVLQDGDEWVLFPLSRLYRWDRDLHVEVAKEFAYQLEDVLNEAIGPGTWNAETKTGIGVLPVRGPVRLTRRPGPSALGEEVVEHGDIDYLMIPVDFVREGLSEYKRISLRFFKEVRNMPDEVTVYRGGPPHRTKLRAGEPVPGTDKLAPVESPRRRSLLIVDKHGNIRHTPKEVNTTFLSWNPRVATGEISGVNFSGEEIPSVSGRSVGLAAEDVVRGRDVRSYKVNLEDITGDVALGGIIFRGRRTPMTAIEEELVAPVSALRETSMRPADMPMEDAVSAVTAEMLRRFMQLTNGNKFVSGKATWAVMTQGIEPELAIQFAQVEHLLRDMRMAEIQAGARMPTFHAFEATFPRYFRPEIGEALGVLERSRFRKLVNKYFKENPQDIEKAYRGAHLGNLERKIKAEFPHIKEKLNDLGYEALYETDPAIFTAIRLSVSADTQGVAKGLGELFTMFGARLDRKMLGGGAGQYTSGRAAAKEFGLQTIRPLFINLDEAGTVMSTEKILDKLLDQPAQQKAMKQLERMGVTNFRQQIRDRLRTVLSEPGEDGRMFVRTDVWNLENLMIPNDIMEGFRHTAKVMYDPRTPGAVMKVLNNLTRMWKTAVTVPFVEFHSRNMLGGNIWANFLGGVINPIDYTTAFFMMLDDIFMGGGRKQAFGKWHGTSREFMEQAADGGDLGYGTFTTADLANVEQLGSSILHGKARGLGEGLKTQFVRPGQKFGAARALLREVPLPVATTATFGVPIFGPDTGRMVGNFLESWAKVTHLVNKLKKGYPWSMASMSSKMHLFNYADITPFERTLKQFIPFWTWTRNNIPLQIRSLVQKPGRVAVLQHVIEAWENHEGGPIERTLVAPWIRERIFGLKMNHDGVAEFLQLPGYGLEDIGAFDSVIKHDLTTGSGAARAFGDAVRSFASTWTPWLRVPFELGTEHVFFTDSDLKAQNTAPPILRHLPVLFKEGQALLDAIDYKPVHDELGEVKKYRADPHLMAVMRGFTGGRFTSTMSFLETKNGLRPSSSEPNRILKQFAITHGKYTALNQARFLAMGMLYEIQQQKHRWAEEGDIMEYARDGSIRVKNIANDFMAPDHQARLTRLNWDKAGTVPQQINRYRDLFEKAAGLPREQEAFARKLQGLRQEAGRLQGLGYLIKDRDGNLVRNQEKRPMEGIGEQRSQYEKVEAKIAQRDAYLKFEAHLKKSMPGLTRLVIEEARDMEKARSK